MSGSHRAPSSHTGYLSPVADVPIVEGPSHWVGEGVEVWSKGSSMGKRMLLGRGHDSASRVAALMIREQQSPPWQVIKSRDERLDKREQ